jgi:small subunit ribosomal protein S20
MPILKGAKKALRSSKRKAAINQVVKSKAKTAISKVKTSQSAAALSAAFSAIDKAVKKNMVHRNKAARLKSQLSKVVATAKK